MCFLETLKFLALYQNEWENTGKTDEIQLLCDLLTIENVSSLRTNLLRSAQGLKKKSLFFLFFSWAKETEKTLLLTSFVLHQVEQEVGAVQDPVVPEGIWGTAFLVLPRRSDTTETLRHVKDTHFTEVPNVESSSVYGIYFYNSKQSKCLSLPFFTCGESGDFHCVVFVGFVKRWKVVPIPQVVPPNFPLHRRPFCLQSSLVRCYCTLKCFSGPLAGWQTPGGPGGGKGGGGAGLDMEAYREPEAMLELLLSKKVQVQTCVDTVQQSHEVQR